MRFRKTSRRGFVRSKRTANWIESLTLSNLDGELDRSTFTLAPLAAIRGAQVFLQLVDNIQLGEHGGEGAVVARIVGDLHLIGARKNAVATSAFLHLAVVQKDSNVTTGLVEPQNLFQAAENGKDNILWDTTLFCPALSGAVPAQQPWPISTHVDIRVSRRVENENFLYLCISSAGAFNDTIVNEVTLAGALRILVKRPR